MWTQSFLDSCQNVQIFYWNTFMQPVSFRKQPIKSATTHETQETKCYMLIFAGICEVIYFSLCNVGEKITLNVSFEAYKII